jgi:hypothetical protein
MIQFPNTERELYNYGELFRQVYKDNNAAAGYDPSQPLMNDVSFDVQSAAGNFSIVFHLPDYWKYAEYGRPPGKMPPKGSLLKWMEWKRILPHPMTLRNGRTVIPSMDSLEFLIRRKIGGTLWPYGPSPDGKPAEKVGGTEATAQHTWEATEHELHDRLVRDVKAALTKDFTEYLRSLDR